MNIIEFDVANFLLFWDKEKSSELLIKLYLDSISYLNDSFKNLTNEEKQKFEINTEFDGIYDYFSINKKDITDFLEENLLNNISFTESTEEEKFFICYDENCFYLVKIMKNEFLACDMNKDLTNFLEKNEITLINVFYLKLINRLLFFNLRILVFLRNKYLIINNNVEENKKFFSNFSSSNLIFKEFIIFFWKNFEKITIRELVLLFIKKKFTYKVTISK